MISYKYMIPHNNGTAPSQLQQCNNSIFTDDQPLNTTPLARRWWLVDEQQFNRHFQSRFCPWIKMGWWWGNNIKPSNNVSHNIINPHSVLRRPFVRSAVKSSQNKRNFICSTSTP